MKDKYYYIPFGQVCLNKVMCFGKYRLETPFHASHAILSRSTAFLISPCDGENPPSLASGQILTLVFLHTFLIAWNYAS